jgi:hypothetical protein
MIATIRIRRILFQLLCFGVLLIHLPRAYGQILTPDSLTLFGAGSSGKAVFTAPIGCFDDLRVSIQDPSIASVTPLTVDAVASQVFTVTGLKVGSTIVRIDYAGTTPLCTGQGSRILTVNVIEPPVITKEPAGQAVIAGTDVTFTVVATGALLRYQWWLNGVIIPGATASFLTIPKVQSFNAGDYSVTVYNLAGAVNSRAASLSVTDLATLPFTDSFADPKNLIVGANGVGRGSNLDSSREAGEPFHANRLGTNSVWLRWRPPASGAAILSTLGSGFDTLLAVYTGSSVRNLTEVASDNDGGGFLTSQLKFYAVADTEYYIAVDGYHGAKGEVVFRWNLFPLVNPLTKITVQPTDQSALLGDRVSLEVNYKISEPARVQWLRDGVLVRDVSAGDSDRLEFASLGRGDVGNYLCRVVTVAAPDDSVLEVPSRVIRLQVHLRGDGAVVRDIFTRDKLFEVLDAASILPGGQGLQKSGRRKQAGGPATGYTGTQIFSTFGSTRESGEPNHCGVAGGASEWYSYVPPTNGLLRISTDGSDFDTVLAVYVVPSGQSVNYENLQSVACDNDSGVNGRTSAVTFSASPNETYYIAVDGVNGQTGTAELHYELGVAPMISQQPASRTVPSGSTVSLTVSATGYPAPGFQWQSNQVEVAGATNTNLTITNFQAASQGSYRVLASNSSGLALSAPATLLLDSPVRWGSLSIDAIGLFHPQLVGPGNTNYVVEASTDLITWTPLATNVVLDGIWNYVDVDSTNFNLRFYRALQGP